MALVTVYSDFGAQENSLSLFPLFFHLFTMKWQKWMPWSSFSECWVLSQFFTLLFLFHQEVLQFLFAFCQNGGIICISEVIDSFSQQSYPPACASSSPAFHMMYSSYKLYKQGDNIQPWHTPLPIWNRSVLPHPVLTVASWPAYRFLRRQVRWSGTPISFRIF